MRSNRLVIMWKMSKIQLIDLDMSSDEEEMGGMMILRRVMQGQLGWLSTVVEPDMKQEPEAMEGVTDVQEVHAEDQVQGAHEDQLSHALTDTLEITEVTKNKDAEAGKEEKEVMGNLGQVEITEPVKDAYTEASEQQKDMIEKAAEFEVMETVKEEKEEMNKEQGDVVEKQKIMQLATIEAAQQIVASETKTKESDIPVEENEEAMLLEDGILLTYVEKQSCTNKEAETAEIRTTPIAEVPACNADNWTPMSREVDDISEKSQKSQAEDITVAPSTSQPMVKNDEISVEETFEEHPSRINMVDKLVKAAGNLGNEVRNEENIKIPAIDLLLQIQVALNEHQLCPENTTINILEIINRIPDKSALAWQEKLNGEMIDSHQAKALADSLLKESKAREQERKQQRKDAYVTQKCVEILQNAAKTYEFALKTAAGLADLAGMCYGEADFKEMMSIVVELPSKIQQQAEMKIKEAEEKGMRIHDKIELVNIESLDELMTATILPKFDEKWEHPHHEPTKYLAALFEYWLRKGMFPDKKPNVHQIVVKFKCSITVLQSYLRGYIKPPHMQELKEEQYKRKRVMSFEETDCRVPCYHAAVGYTHSLG